MRTRVNNKVDQYHNQHFRGFCKLIVALLLLADKHGIQVLTHSQALHLFLQLLRAISCIFFWTASSFWSSRCSNSRFSFAYSCFSSSSLFLKAAAFSICVHIYILINISTHCKILELVHWMSNFHTLRSSNILRRFSPASFCSMEANSNELVLTSFCKKKISVHLHAPSF